jgi:hypothetical protein
MSDVLSDTFPRVYYSLPKHRHQSPRWKSCGFLAFIFTSWLLKTVKVLSVAHASDCQYFPVYPAFFLSDFQPETQLPRLACAGSMFSSWFCCSQRYDGMAMPHPQKSSIGPVQNPKRCDDIHISRQYVQGAVNECMEYRYICV